MGLFSMRLPGSCFCERRNGEPCAGCEQGNHHCGNTGDGCYFNHPEKAPQPPMAPVTPAPAPRVFVEGDEWAARHPEDRDVPF